MKDFHLQNWDVRQEMGSYLVGKFTGKVMGRFDTEN
jgi:hypothetical protein